MRKFILFELNEVPFEILEYYVEKYPNSNLAKIYPQCAKYKTITEDVGLLEPWITWPTLHRGVHNETHLINDFGEELIEVNHKYPSIWEILHNNNISTGVFASIHSYPLPTNYSEYKFYVPDLFAKKSTTHPKKVTPFQEFNLRMTRKSGRNVDTGIDKKSALKFVANIPRIGIKLNTIRSLVNQVLNERKQPWIKARRRTFQSILSYDVFMKLLNQKKPQFASFFSNHVASTTHRYWAATFPKSYKNNEIPESWIKQYSGEIDFVMHTTDKFLSGMLKFLKKNKEYKLVLTSSMGQQPTQSTRLVKSEVYLRDNAKFMKFLGIEEGEWEVRNAMHPQYNFYINSEEKARLLEEKVKSFEFEGKEFIYRVKDKHFFSIEFGYRNLQEEVMKVQGEKVPFSNLGLVNDKVDDSSPGTARHDKIGSLLIFDPKDNSKKGFNGELINTKAFAPSFLSHYDLTIPSYMINQRIKEVIE